MLLFRIIRSTLTRILIAFIHRIRGLAAAHWVDQQQFGASDDCSGSGSSSSSRGSSGRKRTTSSGRSSNTTTTTTTTAAGAHGHRSTAELHGHLAAKDGGPGSTGRPCPEPPPQHPQHPQLPAPELGQPQPTESQPDPDALAAAAHAELSRSSGLSTGGC